MSSSQLTNQKSDRNPSRKNKKVKEQPKYLETRKPKKKRSISKEKNDSDHVYNN